MQPCENAAAAGQHPAKDDPGAPQQVDDEDGFGQIGIQSHLNLHDEKD